MRCIPERPAVTRRSRAHWWLAGKRSQARRGALASGTKAGIRGTCGPRTPVDAERCAMAETRGRCRDSPLLMRYGSKEVGMFLYVRKSFMIFKIVLACIAI